MHPLPQVCNECQQLLPITAFEQVGQFRWRGTCIECVNRIKQRTEKECVHCHQVKPLAAFPRSGSSFDGHRHTCKACIPLEKAEQIEREKKIRERQQFLSTLEGQLLDVVEQYGPQTILIDERGVERTAQDELDRLRAERPKLLNMRARRDMEWEDMENFSGKFYAVIIFGWDSQWRYRFEANSITF